MQAMGRVSRARGVGFGLQRAQALPPHGRTPALAAHPVPFMAQRHLEPTGAVAAFVEAKDLPQHRFPGRCFRTPHRPLFRGLLGVKAAGRHAQHLAEPPYRVVAALGGNEAIAAHGSGVCENLRVKQALAMAFFYMSSSCVCRRLAARPIGPERTPTPASACWGKPGSRRS